MNLYIVDSLSLGIYIIQASTKAGRNNRRGVKGSFLKPSKDCNTCDEKEKESRNLSDSKVNSNTHLYGVAAYNWKARSNKSMDALE